MVDEATLSANEQFWNAEDEDDPRTPAQWLIDMALLPGLVVLLTSLILWGSSYAIWATFCTWRAIGTMIG